MQHIMTLVVLAAVNIQFRLQIILYKYGLTERIYYTDYSKNNSTERRIYT